jgi:hypothetical protein
LFFPAETSLQKHFAQIDPNLTLIEAPNLQKKIHRESLNQNLFWRAENRSLEL